MNNKKNGREEFSGELTRPIAKDLFPDFFSGATGEYLSAGGPLVSKSDILNCYETENFLCLDNDPALVRAYPVGFLSQEIGAPFAGNGFQVPVTAENIFLGLGAKSDWPFDATGKDLLVASAIPTLNQERSHGITISEHCSLWDSLGDSSGTFVKDFSDATGMQVSRGDLLTFQDLESSPRLTDSLTPTCGRFIYEDDFDGFEEKVCKRVLERLREHNQGQHCQDDNNEIGEGTTLVMELFGRVCRGALGLQLQGFLKGARQVLQKGRQTKDAIGQAAESMTRLFECLPNALHDMDEVRRTLRTTKEKRIRNAQIARWLGIDPSTSHFEQEMPIRKYADFYDCFCRIRHDSVRCSLAHGDMQILVNEAEYFLARLLKKIQCN